MNRGVAVAAATGALVATLAGGALAAEQIMRLSDRREVATTLATQESAMAAGRQIAVDFVAYDYRRIDADFTRVTNESVGKLKTDFATQAAGVRQLIVQAKAVSTAVIVSAGLVSQDGSSARVIVSLNRTVVNTQAPKGQTNAVDLQIDLVRQHGRWLASAVRPL